MKNMLLTTGLRILGVPRWLYRVLLLASLLASATHLWADTLTGRVVGVSDGDTITVLSTERVRNRIRLQGIDAPESGQAFGSVSKRTLSDLVFGQTVVVRFDKQDRYGRILGVVFLGSQDINLEMISNGMAWHYKHYQRDQAPVDRARYAAAEIAARTARRGLWRDSNPVPPWDFRRSGD